MQKYKYHKYKEKQKGLCTYGKDERLCIILLLINWKYYKLVENDVQEYVSMFPLFWRVWYYVITVIFLWIATSI